MAQPKGVGQLVRQGTTHLHCRALAPYRGAKQVRYHRADQYQRHHAQRHHFVGAVDLLQQQIVAPLHSLPKAQVDPTHSKARNGQEPDQPAVAIVSGRGPIQRVKERSRGRTGQCRHQAGQQ